MSSKSEIRNPKSETNSNFEEEMFKTSPAGRCQSLSFSVSSLFLVSDFGFISDFGFRISDL